MSCKANFAMHEVPHKEMNPLKEFIYPYFLPQPDFGQLFFLTGCFMTLDDRPASLMPEVEAAGNFTFKPPVFNPRVSGDE